MSNGSTISFSVNGKKHRVHNLPMNNAWTNVVSWRYYNSGASSIHLSDEPIKEKLPGKYIQSGFLVSPATGGSNDSLNFVGDLFCFENGFFGYALSHDEQGVSLSKDQDVAEQELYRFKTASKTNSIESHGLLLSRSRESVEGSSFIISYADFPKIITVENDHILRSIRIEVDEKQNVIYEIDPEIELKSGDILRIESIELELSYETLSPESFPAGTISGINEGGFIQYYYDADQSIEQQSSRDDLRLYLLSDAQKLSVKDKSLDLREFNEEIGNEYIALLDIQSANVTNVAATHENNRTSSVNIKYTFGQSYLNVKEIVLTDYNSSSSHQIVFAITFDNEVFFEAGKTLDLTISTQIDIASPIGVKGSFGYTQEDWDRYWKNEIQSLDGTVTTATRSNFGLDLSGSAKWQGGVLAPNGKIYCIPRSTDNVLIIDTENETAITSNMGSDLSGGNKWIGGVLASDGKIYTIPLDAESVLIIDPLSDTAVKSFMGLELSARNKWTGGVLGPDGKIYGIPFDSTDILIIDPESQTAVRSDMGADLSGSAKWQGGSLGSDGKIYGVPYRSSDILIIDTETQTATRSTMGTEFGGRDQWRGGVLGPDGKIYGIPYLSRDILIIDPETQTATRSDMGFGGEINNRYEGGALGADGKIYGIPNDGAGSIIIIDVETQTISLSRLGAEIPNINDQWSDGNLAKNGKIYCVPYGNTDVLIIGEGSKVSEELALSPYLNKY